MLEYHIYENIKGDINYILVSTSDNPDIERICEKTKKLETVFGIKEGKKIEAMIRAGKLKESLEYGRILFKKTQQLCIKRNAGISF